MDAVQRRRPFNDNDTDLKQSSETTTATEKRTNEATIQQSATKNNTSIGKVLKAVMIGIAWGLAFFFLGSYLLTETWTWGYRGKWTNLHTYLPQKQKVFTEKELLQYDGSNPNLPIYLAVDGDVFDVTKGRGWYGHGGSYGHFSGKDAARAYVTGCFEDHLTHDLRGLSAAQLKGVEHWKSFYANHHTYYKVGTVIHPPLDDNTPIPPPCRQAVGQKP